MENKIKYRVLGVSIVVVLVFLLLPFMQQHERSVSDVRVLSNPSSSEKDNINGEGELISVPASPVIPIPDDYRKSTSLAHEAQNQVSVEKVNIETNSQVVSKTSVKEKTLAKKSIITNKQAMKPQPVNITAKTSNQKTKILAHQAIIKNNGLFDIKTPIWVVQVGTFNSKAKADKLLNHLRADGYHVFYQCIQGATGTTYLVFVGPLLNYQAASLKAHDILKSYHLNSMVARYKPLWV